MKKIMWGLAIILCGALMGCSGAFWGGTGAGVLGAGAGYEIQAERQMREIDEALKNGKITQEEYNIRKDQIKKGSLIK